MSDASGKWTTADIPSQSGRVAVITGANTGLGFETAKALAEKQATVVLACRNQAKADEAKTQLKNDVPGASVEVVVLDLSDLDSVQVAARQIRQAHPRLDLLLNNAGVMWTSQAKTQDGFELQFGTNHLGHFAFTGLLLDCLSRVPGSRIVTVSSIAHRTGAIHFDNPQLDKNYGRQKAYSQSKLANLLFTYHLNERLRAADSETIAVAAHPGVSRTELGRHAPAPFRLVDETFGRFFLQTSLTGALATLRAATDPEVAGGEYYGPRGFMEFHGHPTRVTSNATSRDAETAQRLWALSEQLTGVTFPI